MTARIQEWLTGLNIPAFNLPKIGFWEVADIFIVAYIVYFIMQWIRQTRAWSLLKGVVIILAIAAVAYIFRLTTVLWILQNAITAGLIVVVILFQPELRKALEQIGRGKIFSSIYKTDSHRGARLSLHTVNEVVKAVKEMSSVKTGALIVLEQEVALGDHERTGIAVDATVSSQLLLNIFEKNTPLHDGAVIIRNNRVVAATCILPLTSLEIGHDLGTRHRAAVGISEVSDALVVVVSEETGAVSVTEGGIITRKMNEHQLRDRLLTNKDGERQNFHLLKSVKNHIKKERT